MELNFLPQPVPYFNHDLYMKDKEMIVEISIETGEQSIALIHHKK